MRPLSATIHTSVLSMVDLEGLALDAGRPGRLTALEEIKGGDSVHAVINEPGVAQEVTAENYSVGRTCPLPLHERRRDVFTKTTSAR